MDKEYAGITGVPSFTKAAGALAYGDDSPAIKENRVRIFDILRSAGFWLLIILISLLSLNPSLVPVLSVWVLNSSTLGSLTPRTLLFLTLPGETTSLS